MVKYRNWKAFLIRTVFLFLLLFGCKLKPPIPLSKQIQGEWVYSGRYPKVYHFSGDSVEFLHGFFCKGEYNERYRTTSNIYAGQIVPFQVKKDSIFYRDPCFKNWQLLGTIRRLQNDTLILKMQLPENGTEQKSLTFIRERATPDTSQEFDKVVFSMISWNYTQLSPEISVDKAGNVYFAGGTWQLFPGFYYGKVDTADVKNLFDKLNKAKLPVLPDKMDEGNLDGSTAYTTFIKNGRIIKSLKHHFGSLHDPLIRLDLKIWQAYYGLANLPAKLEYEKKLKPLPSALPVSVLHFLLFSDGKMFTELSPSEALYFWTELQKAKPVEIPFKPTYRLLCSERFGSIEKEQGKHPDPLLYELATDGRFYKFPDKDGKPRIYDLGYNFLERNKMKIRFKEATPDDQVKIKDRATGYIYW